MATIARVKYLERPNEDDKDTAVERELPINLNCPIGLIMDHVGRIAGLDERVLWDLCDETTCQLRNVRSFGPETLGLQVLQTDTTYLIITYERDASGQMTTVTPILKESKRIGEILARMRKSSRRGSKLRRSSSLTDT